MVARRETRRLLGAAPGVFDEQDADVIDVTPSGTTPLDDDIDAEELKITSEFDADENDVTWLIKVYLKNKKTGVMDYIFQCLPSDLPIVDRLRDEYTEPGESATFKARVYRNEGKGKQLYRVLEYSITATKNKKLPENQNSDLKAVLETMAGQQAALMETLKTSRMPTVQPDPTESMIKMATAMGMMMQALKPMTAPAPTSDPMAMMPMMFKFLELGKEMAGGSEPAGSNFIDLARDLFKAVPAILPAVMAANAANAANVAKPRQVPQPGISAPQQAPAGTSEAPENNEDKNSMPTEHFPPQVAALLKMQLPSLINKAVRGSDTTLYADFILDNVPFELIEEHIVDEQFVDKLALIDPRVSQNRPWFDQLRLDVLSALTPDDETATTPLNVSHPTTDDAASAHADDANVDGNTVGSGGDVGDA